LYNLALLWQVETGSYYYSLNESVSYEFYLKKAQICSQQTDSSDPFVQQHLKYFYEIQRDVTRALPEIYYYQTEAGVNSLQNVLMAFSWRNPIISYCQGMVGF
jgi:hypothetical protein